MAGGWDLEEQRMMKDLFTKVTTRSVFDGILDSGMLPFHDHLCPGRYVISFYLSAK